MPRVRRTARRTVANANGGTVRKSAPRAAKRLITKPPRVWDDAGKLHVIRQPPNAAFYGKERLEPGVNYFVLMLEQLGAVPHFSCEGHPNSFYVLFEAPMALAVKLRQCGYFTVELEGRNLWSLRINREIDETTRKRILRWAAAAWEDKLGPLDWKKVTKENSHAKLV